MPLPQLTALARRVQEVDPGDRPQRAAIHRQLIELRDLLHRGSREDVVRLLEACAVLLEQIEHLGSLTPMTTFAILAELMGRAEGLLGGAPGPDAAPTAGPGPTQETPPVTLGGGGGNLPFNNDVMLGEILKNLGIVDAGQIERALEMHGTLGIRIGDALVRIGAATPRQVKKALQIQNQLRFGTPLKATPPKEPPRPARAEPPRPQRELATAPQGSNGLALRLPSERLFGEVAIELGFTTAEQVQSALSIQRATGVRLGEALVGLGAMTWGQVKEVVAAQQRLRHVTGQPSLRLED